VGFGRNIYAKRSSPNAAPANTEFSLIHDLTQISYFYQLKQISAIQFLSRDLPTLGLASNLPLYLQSSNKSSTLHILLLSSQFN